MIKLPLRVSDAHGLCIVGPDGVVADLTPDSISARTPEEARDWAEQIVRAVNAYPTSEPTAQAEASNPALFRISPGIIISKKTRGQRATRYCEVELFIKFCPTCLARLTDAVICIGWLYDGSSSEPIGPVSVRAIPCGHELRLDQDFRPVRSQLTYGVDI